VVAFASPLPRIADLFEVGDQTARFVDDTILIDLLPGLKRAILHVVLLGILVVSASNFTLEDRFYSLVKVL
jgi:hypothetical protein